MIPNAHDTTPNAYPNPYKHNLNVASSVRMPKPMHIHYPAALASVHARASPRLLRRKHVPNLLVRDDDILHRILSSLEVIEMVVDVRREEHLCSASRLARIPVSISHESYAGT
jgi:hypothetical protein